MAMHHGTRVRRRRMAELLDLLQHCEGIAIGSEIDQLDHALQTATLVRNAGGSPELIFGGLMHDVGRLVAPHAHGRASADLIAPFVGEEVYWVVRLHDEIRLPELAGDDGPVSTAGAYAAQPWFPLACRFAGDWDRHAFVAGARTLPLPFFIPMLDELCMR